MRLRVITFLSLFVFFSCMSFSLLYGESIRGYLFFPSDIQWDEIESTHFKVLYPSKDKEVALFALSYAEEAWIKISPFFNEAPQKIYILLVSFGSSLNGYSLDLPIPHIVIYLDPPQAFSSLSSLDYWLKSVILHELTHSLHFYPAHGAWRLLRNVFGSWVLPNALMPAHLHEGIATFLETILATSGGRGRSPFFEAITRNSMLQKSFGTTFSPLDLLDGVDTIYPQGSSRYYFGEMLYEYLFSLQGKKGIQELTEAFSSNWPYWISSPFEKVFHTSFETLWKETFQWKKDKSTNLLSTSTSMRPSSNKQWITSSGFDKWDLTSNLSIDNETNTFPLLSFRKNHPLIGQYIEFFNPVEKKTIHEEYLFGNSLEGTCIRSKGTNTFQTLYTEDWQTNSKHHTTVLKEINWENGALHRKTHFFPVSPDEEEGTHKIFTLACTQDLSRLVTFESSHYKSSLNLYTFQKDSLLSNSHLQQSLTLPDGSWVSGLTMEYQNKEKPTSLSVRFILILPESFKLCQWTPSPQATALCYDITWGQKSNKIVASQLKNYNNKYYLVSNILNNINQIWSFTDPIPGKLKALTLEKETIGDIRSLAFANHTLYALDYHEEGDIRGYDLVEFETLSGTETQIPIVNATRQTTLTTLTPNTTPSPPSKAPPPSLPMASSTTLLGSPSSHPYDPLSTFYPTGWIPSLLFVPFGVQMGAQIPFFDITQKNYAELSLGYDTRGLPFIDLFYQYRWKKSWSLETETDFSPLFLIIDRTFLKRWGSNVGITQTFLFNQSAQALVGLFGVFRRIETSSLGPAFQSVGFGVSYQLSIRYAPPSYLSTNIMGRFNYFLAPLGSYSNYYMSFTELNQTIPNPLIKNHNFFFRMDVGVTEGSPIYNSFYQGGGELYFQQGRGIFLDRGFYPGTFFGTRMVTFNPEYQFPIVQVERGWGTLPFLLKTLSGSLITDFLTFDFNNPTLSPPLFQNFYVSSGVELKSFWRFLYYFDSEVRLGVYYGFSPYAPPFYVSLGINSKI